MKFRWSRREFLVSTTAGIMVAAAQPVFDASQSLPKRRLGKTSEMVSCIGFGSGTRFCSIQDEAEAQALLELLPQEGWPAGVGTVLIPAARGRLRLAQGRPADALVDFRVCAAMVSPDFSPRYAFAAPSTTHITKPSNNARAVNSFMLTEGGTKGLCASL